MKHLWLVLNKTKCETIDDRRWERKFGVSQIATEAIVAASCVLATQEPIAQRILCVAERSELPHVSKLGGVEQI